MRVAYVCRDLPGGPPTGSDAEVSSRACAAAAAGHDVHLVGTVRAAHPAVHARWAPPRAGHRYLAPAHAHADRVYDTLRALHAEAPLDAVEFAGAGDGYTVVRAARLLGEFRDVRLAVPPDATGGDEPPPSTVDDAVARHLADYCRRYATGAPAWAPSGSAGGLVSVVIPVRDQGRYLPEAVDSAVRCGYRPLEIVVVDDGSTDPATVAALDELRRRGAADVPVTLLRQPPLGLSRARNAGIGAARGGYLVPLDADDLLPAGFLDAAVAALDREPGIGCVGGDVRNFGLLDHVGVPLGYVPDISLVVNTFPRATAVFRTGAVAAAGGYDPQLSAFEDWDLYLRLHKAGYAVECVPLVGQHYRRHRDSMSVNQDRADRLALSKQLLRRHADLLSGTAALALLLTLVDLWHNRYEPSASAALRQELTLVSTA
jgi:GT2 family glycosyltransferase